MEQAFLFDCVGALLPGVLSLPESGTASVGVLIVVGGPQYRVGSHRQFVLLARALADNGIPCMRFDYRGMGDAQGEPVAFDGVDVDIKAALDAFQSRVPGLSGFVLWGLCDAASAISLYAPADPRLRGLVLLNPWVRTESGEANTYLKHYYLKRFFDPVFWKKLLSGGVSLSRSLGGLFGTVQRARQKEPPLSDALPDRMLRCLKLASLPSLFVLSGRDFVADEFRARVAMCEGWQEVLSAGQVLELAEADHTFSSKEWRDMVAGATVEWVVQHNSA